MEAGLRARSDVAILRFALTLEYLQAAFYAEALRRGRLRGERCVFARAAGADERAHVAVLEAAVGRRADERPQFDFGAATRSPAAFTRAAIALEQIGVGAYKGQAARIRSKEVLRAALAIHSVEARHVGWIRGIAGLNPAPHGLDAPLSRAQTRARLARMGIAMSGARRG